MSIGSVKVVNIFNPYKITCGVCGKGVKLSDLIVILDNGKVEVMCDVCAFNFLKKTIRSMHYAVANKEETEILFCSHSIAEREEWLNNHCSYKEFEGWRTYDGKEVVYIDF